LNFFLISNKKNILEDSIFFLGKMKTLESIFLGENFSISENNIIIVEAAKVLCMVLAMMPLPRHGWNQHPHFDHG
jgi:hypothetical protein